MMTLNFDFIITEKQCFPADDFARRRMKKAAREGSFSVL